MKQPTINFVKVFGVLFFYLGYLLFLTALHLITIDNTGSISDVLNTTFIVFLYILYALLIFTGVFVLWYIFNWLVWTIQTPQWKKQEISQQRIIAKQQSQSRGIR